MEGAVVDESTRRLVHLGGLAVETMESLLADPEAADPVKLRTAQVVLDLMVKLRELRNMEQRLANLEEMVYEGGVGPD